MRYNLTIVVILTFFITSGYAQKEKIKFKDIPKDLLQSTAHSTYPEADAAIIYRKNDLSIKYSNSKQEFELFYTITERIKIYNDDGFDYADYTIPLYAGKSSIRENLVKLTAITYNIEGGKITKKRVRQKRYIHRNGR